MPFSLPSRPLGPGPRRPLAAAIGVIAAWACVCGQAAELTVEVNGARSTQGTVSAALYGSADAWLKEPQKTRGARVAAALPTTVLVFHDLPPGRYALSAFHDENGDEKLDTNVVGMPTERTGFSRDARGRMGPPAFEDAAFDLRDDATITLPLR